MIASGMEEKFKDVQLNQVERKPADTVDVIDSKTYERLKSQRQKYDQDIRLWLGQTTSTTS